MYTLDCELRVKIGLEQTFKVFEDPYNLARITPPWLGFRILTQGLKMARGTQIDYEFRWLGVPLTWKTEITAYQPPHHFVDQAIRSPYALWRHHHTFREIGEGTMVSDRVEYELPLGPAGRLAHFVVARQLCSIFEYRQNAILDILDCPGEILQAPRIRWS